MNAQEITKQAREIVAKCLSDLKSSGCQILYIDTDCAIYEHDGMIQTQQLQEHKITGDNITKNYVKKEQLQNIISEYEDTYAIYNGNRKKYFAFCLLFEDIQELIKTKEMNKL